MEPARDQGAVRYLDDRSGTAPFLRKAMRYVFPDHWSFLLGEVALYAFLVLVGTGIYLTLFFDPSTAPTVYHGSYAPLQGVEMTHAYRSVVDLSFDVKAGLLMRQTHHWAADVFLAAITLHLLRIFFTGAFRKPRDLTYYLGVTMLLLALLEGFLGYSLVDDLLSGMGLAIGYSVAMSIPLVGANLASLLWGGPFPGVPAFWSRMYVAHVLLLPVLIGTLLALALFLVAARHHTQFRSERRDSSTAWSGRRCSRARRRGRSGCCSPSPRCSCCSAGSSRSTRSGSGGRTTSPRRRTARSRTGTSAG